VRRLLSQEDERETSASEENIISQKDITTEATSIAGTVELDKKRQKGDISVYKYFCEASGYHNVALALDMAVASAFCVVYSSKPTSNHSEDAMLTSGLQNFGCKNGCKLISKAQMKTSHCIYVSTRSLASLLS
jgi:hypothetical protein